MKKLLFISLLLLFITRCTNSKETTTMDQQSIIQNVTAFFQAVDERNWQQVENSFADQVLFDYSSMSGEKPATLRPTEITTLWKALLPGFDATKHTLSNTSVTVNGNEATVTSDGHGVHDLEMNGKKEQWVVEGHYLLQLKKINAAWKTTAIQFTKEKMSGNLDLPNHAKERVKNELSAQKKVIFDSEGLVLTGKLHLPDGFTEDKLYKPIIVTGSWTTVKEQMPDLYAAKLAKQGYVALTFDFRNYGESEGQPRNYEVPALKTQDIKNAVNYIKTLPFVDKENVGALAICASSGYMADALVQGADIKAVTMVAPWLHNHQLVEGLYGGKAGVQQKIARGTAAKKKFAETGQVDYVPGTSKTDQNAAMPGDFPYYQDAQRGAVPEWGNQFAVMAWPGWLDYDPISQAGRIKVPMLMVHSKKAALPEGAEQFYKQLATTKNIIWVDKATQFDFYDQEPYTTNAATAAGAWFETHLR